MTARAWLRAGSLALAAGLLVGGAPLAAHADGPTPSPSPAGTATPAPAATPSAEQLRVAAEAQRIAREIVALQRTAEQKGEAAQKAAERANARKADADAAEVALHAANDAAVAAQVRATRSRAAASALAARLARTDLGTLPLSLLLNGRTAEGVLGSLSTTGQLSGQAQLLYRQAQADELEAARLQSVATTAADRAEAALERAAKAAAAAKREAASAAEDVEDALAQQRALLVGADDAAVCDAAGTAPVSVCLPDTSPPAGSSTADRVVAYALQQIGKPYVFAAAGPDAFDCSGLTLTAYASAGVSIGTHSATAQYRLAAQQGDLVPLSEASPGDLLFYTDGGGDMYHVTIYAGAGLMIEAPYPGATVREAPVRAGDLVVTVARFD
ncbi:C40 family peptidase [uncultured Amnibacterium sp.]|uniref:C40 family peptidase n=1 Tax=uncultured Amnibacterium sp. TaxID=1631851 RepID=UPI0035CB0612